MVGECLFHKFIKAKIIKKEAIRKQSQFSDIHDETFCTTMETKTL